MIVASVVMAILTIAVVANSLFITSTIKHINESVSQLPENEEAFGDGSSSIPIIDTIEMCWKKSQIFMDLSLQVVESRAICLLIAQLRVFAETGEFVEFHSTAEQLRILLDHLYESEEFSLRSIL